ncbi:hypothetical protein K4Q20_05895 [Staphylococcus epidermidis]|nr:hypothetical protein [Staphylococcus epidermidis]
MNAEAKFVSSVMDARLKKAKRERDSYCKQRDEFRLKAEAYEIIEQAYFDNDNYSDEQFMELIEETIEEVESDLEACNGQ